MTEATQQQQQHETGEATTKTTEMQNILRDYMTCYKPIKLTACKKLGKFTIMWLPKTELGKNRKSKKFKNG